MSTQSYRAYEDFLLAASYHLFLCCPFLFEKGNFVALRRGAAKCFYSHEAVSQAQKQASTPKAKLFETPGFRIWRTHKALNQLYSAHKKQTGAFLHSLIKGKPSFEPSRCRGPPFQFELLIKKIQIGEKTMFDNMSPYSLRAEIVGGIARYYISFTDGQAIQRETEVSNPVYLEFLRFIKTERSLRHWDERHREYSELTDETLYERAINPPKNLENIVLDSLRNEQLRLAVQSLLVIQRRRFVLYHEFGLTYEQIAKIEGCHLTSARVAVLRAEENIKEKIKISENQC